MQESEEKVDQKVSKRYCRNNINRSSINVSSSTTGEETNVVISSTTTTTPSVVESACSKKLTKVSVMLLLIGPLTSGNPFHYIIIDGKILQTILNVVGKCPKCQNDLAFMLTAKVL